MELYATTTVWEGDGKLTVYDKTQGVQNVQKFLCGVFDKKPEEIRVLSPYVGGASGSACGRNTRWCWRRWPRSHSSARSASC